MPLDQSPDYFSCFDLAPTFSLDAKQLKKRFHRKSRAFHPDFFTQADAAAQEEALQMSTFINTAYETLSNFDTRMKYVLELKGMIQENEKYALSPLFLMEMMELNEEVMELQFDPVPAKVSDLQKRVQAKEASLLQVLEPTLTAFETQNEAEQLESLQLVKDFFYKKRYLLRLLESLDKFVA